MINEGGRNLYEYTQSILVYERKIAKFDKMENKKYRFCNKCKVETSYKMKEEKI